MKSLDKATMKKALAPLCAVAFLCLGCLGSVLYVNESNPALKENNHWLRLDREESSMEATKRIISTTKTIPASAQDRARQLAMIYRQQGKQAEAAEIYRKLWVSNTGAAFTTDARDLASIYTDMAAYASAVETYQQVLKYDREHLPAGDPGIARDLNNLGQCYYTAACGTADTTLHRKYLTYARDQFEAAKKLLNHGKAQERATIYLIEQNEKLAEKDLNHT